MDGFNFKHKQHAKLAVEAARERAAGVVHTAKVRTEKNPNNRRSRPAITQGEVSFGDSVMVEIASSPAPGEPVVGTGEIVKAWFDWIAEDNPEPIPANVDVTIEIAEHGEYRLIRSACGPRDRGSDGESDA